MKSLTNTQVISGLVKTRINQIGQHLIDLSKLPNDIHNHDTELICALGAYIKSLQIQLELLQK